LYRPSGVGASRPGVFDLDWLREACLRHVCATGGGDVEASLLCAMLLQFLHGPKSDDALQVSRWHIGLYTISLLPTLYGVWHTKGRSKGGGSYTAQ